MSETVHLVVEAGPHKGMEISVGPGGVRVGRSSKNDVVLIDPLLSRYHCRLFFKPGDGLWIADLGSANETFVNDKPIQESRLHDGDKVSIGDTVLRTVHTEPAATGNAEAGTPALDLGLGRRESSVGRRRMGLPILIIALATVVVLALAAWLPKLLDDAAPGVSDTLAMQPPPEDRTLSVTYEKVLADPQNIFRYFLEITREGIIAVQIDDIANERHLRKQAEAAPEYLASLARAIEQRGFFTLQPAYEGVQPDILNAWDLRVTIGKQTHRTRVVNRVEPQIFKDVREILEEAGKNELGLWAIQFSPEKLREMANDAYLLGRKLFEAREVNYGNLARSLKSFEEADWYLETIEPKPDYYPELVSAIETCTEALHQKYEDHNFRAERAIRLRDWSTAANELRVLCQIIPDRSDPRNQEARRKLLDVENRIEGLQ